MRWIGLPYYRVDCRYPSCLRQNAFQWLLLADQLARTARSGQRGRRFPKRATASGRLRVSAIDQNVIGGWCHFRWSARRLLVGGTIGTANQSDRFVMRITMGG